MSTDKSTRQIQELSGPWHFLLDPEDIGEREGWFDPRHDYRTWQQVKVPGAWDLYDRALWSCESIGWYATEIPSAWAQPGQVQRLRFNRVSIHTKVWLNGEYLGEHPDGYLPFEFDVTGRLRTDAPNVLVLRVDNRYFLPRLPGGMKVEWVQYGGILQPVELLTLPPVYLSELAIETCPVNAGAEVICTLEIVNQGETAFEGELAVAITPATDETKTLAMTHAPVACDAAARQTVRLVVRMEQAERWSPQSPTLYVAKAALQRDGHTADGISERFGVRTIEVRGRQVLLNGQPLRIQGVCRYDEYEGYGPTVPVEVLRRELRLLKQVGVNLIRMHYPQDPALLNLADEMGIMVLGEVPLNWWVQEFVGGAPSEHDAAIIDAAEQVLEGLIRRDRNHPCIVIWSMANECGTDLEVGIAAMRRLMRRARELDRTRLVTFVATGDLGKHRAFEEADLVCVNRYPGELTREPESKAYHIADLPARVREEMTRQLRYVQSCFPDKPVLVTEFGSRSIPGMRGDAPYTEDRHAAYLEAAWQGILDTPEIVGGVVWSWADYYHQRDFVGHTSPMPFGPFGVVTVDRRPKQPLYALARMYGGRVEGADSVTG